MGGDSWRLSRQQKTTALAMDEGAILWSGCRPTRA